MARAKRHSLIGQGEILTRENDYQLREGDYENLKGVPLR